MSADDEPAGEESAQSRSISAGGPVDRLSVTLALHGVDLVPDEISRLLGCSPTHGHRRGEPRKSRSANVAPWKTGAWLLRVDCAAPTTASALLEDMLARVSDDDALWSSLSLQYETSVGFGVFLSGWNRSMVLDARSVQRLARMKVTVDFDVYGAVDDDASPDASPLAGRRDD